ncbi:MAG: transglutaminase-like cysteine peptidase [Methylobacteriaceae bacterium]|nr:transglutaminase-like cysteine peptidase [Methylobacteriaceae bacterium]
MQRFWAILAATILMTGLAAANDRSGSLPSPRDSRGGLESTRSAPRSLAAGAAVSVPIGWVGFCNLPENAEDCRVEPLAPRVAAMTAKAWKTVARINRNVNAAVAPVSDLDNYGVEERWTYPVNGRGDCEDYVLLKRRLLIEAGFPRQALLVTVVRERNGEGHAVLTLATSEGDFVLDNKRDQIRLWREAGYAFVKRQSQEDPNLWVDLRATGGEFVAAR